MTTATRLLRIILNVSDLELAQAWYCDALGFTIVEENARMPAWRDRDSGRCARLALGAEEIELIESDPPALAYPADETAADLGFQHFAVVTDDMDAAYARVRRRDAQAISRGGPQQLPAAASGVRAFKFRDPDGHPLELIEFPSSTRESAWTHVPRTPAATLGIDHSAICVEDVERSLGFYGALGLTQQARQVNTGDSQDRLDGLSGAVVDVIALAPRDAATPHLELLRYRSPAPRSATRSATGLDVADTTLVFAVEALPSSSVVRSRGKGVSPDLALDPCSAAAWMRDPDGHAIVLVERD